MSGMKAIGGIGGFVPLDKNLVKVPIVGEKQISSGLRPFGMTTLWSGIATVGWGGFAEWDLRRRGECETRLPLRIPW